MNRLSRIVLASSTVVGMALTSALALNLPANAGSAPQLFSTFPSLRVVSIKVSTDATNSTKVGDTFNYVVELKNDTTETKTVSLTDTLPSEVALVITPTLELTGAISTTPIAPIVISNTVSWRGTLPKDASAKLRMQVKLNACPANEGLSALNKSINNIAVLRVDNNGLGVSSVSFRPAACNNDPTATPTPRVTPGPTPSPTPVSTSTLPADVAVVKYGRLHLDWARPERGWQASWYVGYQNRSERTANAVVINDSPSSNQTLLALRSWPFISPTTTSTGLQFSIGSLSRWRGGSIWLRTSVPATTTASTVLTNSVSISASNDTRLDNNSALVTITLPALPPSITYPRSGATCTETITVTGKAQANAALQLFVDGSPVLTTTANSEGNWAASLKLDEGINVLVVRTLKSGNEPEHDGDDGSGGWGDYRQSNTVFLKVDTDLKWDPISLSFSDPSGDKKYARHWLGWFEEIGWYVGVQPSTTYTVGVRICCKELTATVTLTVPNGTVTPTVINLTDPDGDRIYTGAWTTGSAKEISSGKLILCVRGDGVLRCARGRANPIWPKANHTVFITEGGFDEAKLSVLPGEIVEFVNMDVKARAFSSSANLAAQANASEGLNGNDANDDAVRLEVGESYSVQVPNTKITYYDSQNNTESITLAPSGNAVYLPFVTR